MPEEEAAARQAALERRVAELEGEVRRADEFFSFAVHELKTPITSLEGYVFLLAREARGGGGADPETQARCVEGVSRNSARLLALLDELLEIGRARLGRLELAVEPVDLAEIARAAAQAEAPEAPLSVPVRGAAAVRVRGERRRLLAFVRDMLGDARERAAGAPIAIEVRAERGEAALAVIDRGRLATPAAIEEAFVGTRRTGGAQGATARGGLGLVLGREVVRQLGGRVFADSGEAGNRIGFALPLTS